MASANEAEAAPPSSLLGSLTQSERRFVLQQRTIQMLNSFMHIISTTAHYQTYLEQVQGDVGRLGLHYGRTMSINAAINTFLAPIVGSLSDAWGRHTLHWAGKAGAAIFFMLMPLNHTRFLSNPTDPAMQRSVLQVRSTTTHGYPDHRPPRRAAPPRHPAQSGTAALTARAVLQVRMAIEILGFGVLSAGNWGVFAAAHTDLFADRPALSSRLQAADQMWRDALSIPASLLAAFITPIVWGKSYWWLLYAASAALGWVQLGVAVSMRETLPPGPRRKPFSLAKANPFANVLLLFRNGRGLASLATACSAYFLCQSNWSIAASYRMGVLGWTPAHSSYFNTISNLFSSLSAGKLVLPFMKRAGNRMAFQQGCLIATCAYVGCGLSWIGSSKVRTALQCKIVILSRFVAVRLANPKKYHYFRRAVGGAAAGLAGGLPPFRPRDDCQAGHRGNLGGQRRAQRGDIRLGLPVRDHRPGAVVGPAVQAVQCRGRRPARQGRALLRLLRVHAGGVGDPADNAEQRPLPRRGASEARWGGGGGGRMNWRGPTKPSTFSSNARTAPHT